MFDLNEFINEYVTKRDGSMFRADVEANGGALKAAIEGRSGLVIGGAGSIGSSFIRAILPYRPGELYIVE